MRWQCRAWARQHRVCPFVTPGFLHLNWNSVSQARQRHSYATLQLRAPASAPHGQPGHAVVLGHHRSHCRGHLDHPRAADGGARGAARRCGVPAGKSLLATHRTQTQHGSAAPAVPRAAGSGRRRRPPPLPAPLRSRPRHPPFSSAPALQRLHTGVTRDEVMYKAKKQALLAGELQPAPPVPLPQRQ